MQAIRGAHDLSTFASAMKRQCPMARGLSSPGQAPALHVVPKVHKVYRVEEVEEEKEKEKPEAKSRPKLEEYLNAR